MRTHIQQLASLSRRAERRIIGLMSGTSLDGLDVALCHFRGHGLNTRVKVTHFETLEYEEAFKLEIRKVFAKREVDFQHLTLLNVLIADQHARMVNDCLKRWGATADLIASHGQTLYHAPRVLHGLPEYPNATLQMGDGDHIARKTGIITVSDFRQKHVAAGGEGAPLALIGDYFLFSKKGHHRFLLNIGGIANFTYLPADIDPTRAFATDTGPGNTLLDAFARELFGVSFDENALLAMAGRVDQRLLTILKFEAFFQRPFPKSTGPEMFSAAWVKSAIKQLPKETINPYDLMATLTQLTAETIASGIASIHSSLESGSKQQLYVSGGGAHNPLIMSVLKKKLPGLKVSLMSKLGLDGDAKEAVLFALLANETIAGNHSEQQILGGVPLLGLGKISLPG